MAAKVAALAVGSAADFLCQLDFAPSSTSTGTGAGGRAGGKRRSLPWRRRLTGERRRPSHLKNSLDH
jgi:hypothetical protein